MNKILKYELTDEVVASNGLTLHRIRALRDIPSKGVQAGDFGGFVESEDNLSQDGDAWVGRDAAICGDSLVCGNACVHGNVWVYGDEEVCGDADLYRPYHILLIGPIGPEEDKFTIFRAPGSPFVKSGDFEGTLDDFEKAVSEVHGDNQHGREYKAVIALARLRAQSWEAA